MDGVSYQYNTNTYAIYKQTQQRPTDHIVAWWTIVAGRIQLLAWSIYLHKYDDSHISIR